MKKTLILLIILTITAFSCRKPADVPSLTSIITEGNWYVNLMKKNGVNMTSLYKKWQFTFNADKTVTVTNGVNNYNGTWEEDDLRQNFKMAITSPELELTSICKVWDISFKTPRRVTFQDDKLNPTEELQYTQY